MIQRIQTLFLLAAAVVVLGVSFLPWWENAEYVFQFGEMTKGSESIFTLVYLFAGALFSGAVILINIFLFKNRKLQMKITQLSGLLLAIVLGGGYYILNQRIQATDEIVDGGFTFFFWLIVLAIILNALARIYIKKDEDLVRSVDRIR